MAKIFLSFTLLGLLLAGCASQPTQVIVTVDAESGVKAAATQLHLVVSGGSGDRFDQVRMPGIGEDPAYPFELALAPLDGDASRTWSVTAEAGGARVRAVGGYVEGQTLTVRLLLEDSCRGVVCGAEETCQAGACVDAGGVVVPFGDAGVGSDAGDAGVDLGRDAGDAGVRDAGPIDAGPIRFTDLGDGTVRDVNGLVWQQNRPVSRATYAGAGAYCANLTLSSGGWRLPTVAELSSIVDTRFRDPAAGTASIDASFFPGTPPEPYWTVSPGITPGYGRVVYFTDGRAGDAWPTGTWWARCVR